MSEELEKKFEKIAERIVRKVGREFIEAFLEALQPDLEYRKERVIHQDENTKTTQKKTVPYIEIRYYDDYSEKSWKLFGIDNRYTYIAKQHVKQFEPVDGGGVRVVFTDKASNWIADKLEWKEGK